ncbi:MAG: LanC-like protein [Kofleriaceae bacterium]
MHEPQRHEPLRTIAWDAERARQAIVEIVDDATTAFDPRRFWLAHALDEQIADGSPTLYWGATGVIWGLDHLRRCGAVTTSRDFTPALAPLLAAHAAIAESYGSLAPYASLFMSDVAPLLLHLRLAPNAAVADRLLARLRDNLGLPPLELMWGVAGSMLVALAMAEPRGDALYRELAAHLLGSLREAAEGPIWEQALYNNPPTCLFGLVHGAAGNLAALYRGWHLLDDAQRERTRAATRVLVASAHEDVEGANWPAGSQRWPIRGGAEGALLLQQCHGAPGIVTACTPLPFPAPALERLLVRAGELIWHAGPHEKGANICHGTAGSGYAFLALYRRTGDARWLDRARAFAMHAIEQVDAARDAFSQGRYSLWTGDVGTAIYLWDCITGEPRFPTLDVL